MLIVSQMLPWYWFDNILDGWQKMWKSIILWKINTFYEGKQGLLSALNCFCVIGASYLWIYHSKSIVPGRKSHLKTEIIPIYDVLMFTENDLIMSRSNMKVMFKFLFYCIIFLLILSLTFNFLFFFLPFYSCYYLGYFFEM